MRSALAVLAVLGIGWATDRERLQQVALLVVLCRLFSVRDLKLLTLVTLADFFLVPPFVGVTQPPNFSTILKSRGADGFLTHPGVLVGCLVTKLTLAWIVYRWVRHRSPGLRLVACHGILFALIWLASKVAALGPAQAAAAGLLLCTFSLAFYYLCFLTLEAPDLKVGQFLSLYVAPFWEVGAVPRPQLQIRPDRRDLDGRCIQRALYGMALMLGGGVLDACLCGSSFHGLRFPILPACLPQVESLGLADNLFDLYPRWVCFLSLVWSSLHRITNYFSWSLLFECSFLLLGYDVPPRFTFPWRANSFAEFYNTLMPYYVLLLTRIYLYPLYTRLRRLGWRREGAYDLALVFAVVVGGLTIHIVRDVHLIPLLGAADYFGLYLQTVPYFLLIFLAVRFGRFPEPLARWLPAPVKFMILLSLYSILFLTREGGLFVSMPERLEFARRLLGGGL